MRFIIYDCIHYEYGLPKNDGEKEKAKKDKKGNFLCCDYDGCDFHVMNWRKIKRKHLMHWKVFEHPVMFKVKPKRILNIKRSNFFLCAERKRFRFYVVFFIFFMRSTIYARWFLFVCWQSENYADVRFSGKKWFFLLVRFQLMWLPMLSNEQKSDFFHAHSHYNLKVFPEGDFHMKTKSLGAPIAILVSSKHLVFAFIHIQ